MQQPPSPISERLRTIRRRVTIAVVATFVAAWLAVAAFGKGGQSSGQSASSGSSSQAAPSDGATEQQPSNGPQFGDQGSGDGGYYDDQSGSDGSGGQSDDSGAGSSAPAPLTSSQS
jgi:hypothetical protein